ncbi:DNA primase [Kiritimatiellota bacterium B12222]|nr:DNA primase [Kiritimatiellota bacterium B12222]
MDLETLKEEVRARADIVDIIGRSVKLTRASGSWKGLCPFHQEKSPSFTVNPQRQSYHCFGCDVGGDVFKFVMEMEHLDFMGALEKLAQQTGVEFTHDGNKGNAGLKKKLLEIHEKTTAYFEQLLVSREGEKAFAYLQKRELLPETQSNFRLGFAPDSFDQLLNKAREWGFSEQDMRDSGLFGVRENPRNGEALYDRFRNRLIFPILDEQARVIGFSGRVIPPSDAKAKYLNSPETLLFKKSRVLYGIDKARKAMTEKRRAVLCEGQLDVIRCHESNICEAVASQGTAITENHAQILKRYADEVILLLDADTAGIKAALRSADVLLAEGIITRVASLPPGEDPDDVVRQYGSARLRDIVNAADPFVVFQVRTLVQQEGEITETSRLRVARKVMESLAGVKEAVHREEMLRQAAGALGMREDTLRQDLNTAVAKPAHTNRNNAAPRTHTPPPPRPKPYIPPAPAQRIGIPPTERTLLEMLWANPRLIPEAKTFLRPEHFSSEAIREMLSAMYEVQKYTREGILDTLREHSAGPALIKIDHDSKLPLSEEFGSPEDTLMEITMLLRRNHLSQQRQLLNQQIHQVSDPEVLSDLEAEIFKYKMHETQLKNYTELKEWDKGQMLLSIIDQQ